MAKTVTAPATKPTPASPPPPPAAGSAAEIGLSDAIREGFEAMPEAKQSKNRDATAALKAWVLEKHPNLKAKVESTTWNSTLSGLRKKVPSGTQVDTSGVDHGNPTVRDVDAALELCEHRLKIKPAALLNILEGVNEFGSPILLENSLRALMKFRGETEE